jgi:uncharacterized membrane protein
MRRKPLILLLLVFLTVASILTASDKDYQIKHVLIEAQLNPDGSMDVTESRSFYFQGQFSYLYRSFPKHGPVEFTEITVKEGGITFKESDTRETGTVFRTDDNKDINYKWFISAKNEPRTFQLSYRVLGAVKKYEDKAVLYFQFISPEWIKSQYDVTVTVRTPEFLNRYDVKHWLHGPLWGKSRLEYDGSITAICEKLPSRNFFEIRALYPVETFPAAPELSGYIEQDILAQEAVWADEANARREEMREKIELRNKRYKMGRWLIPFISSILFLLWLYLFRKYGRRPDVETHSDILSEAPEDLPPALVGYLLNSRSITGPCLIATIMDLAKREVIELIHTEIEKRPGKYKQEYALKLNRDKYELQKNELKDHEIELIDFLFSELAFGRDLLEMKIMKKYRSKFVRFFNKWKKSIISEGKKKDWFDRNSVKYGNISLIISLCFSVLSGICVIWFGPQAFILAAVSIIVLILSAIIPHHTSVGRLKYYEWKAFRKYLRKYNFRTESDEVVLSKINDLFIFGTLFGVNKKTFRELGSVIPADRYRNYVPWYTLNSNRKSSFSPAAFGNAMASMISTAGSTMSSASGAGGGASSGGGGGAGSGGGGAG